MKTLQRIGFFVSAAFAIATLNGCNFANSNKTSSSTTPTTSTDASVSTSEDELTSIMNKYNNLPYTYDGEECTISMTHWDSAGANVERSVINAMLKGFNKRYPKIHVDLQILGNYEGTYGNNLSAGNVTDVFLVPDGAFTSWAGFNKMMNLEPYVQASDLVDTTALFPSVVTRYQYNANEKKAGSGTQLALPKDVGPYAMFYNKDIFDAMGVSYPASDSIMDIEAARTMWKSLIKKDSSGNVTRYALGGLGPEGLVWSAGGDFLNSTRDAFPETGTAEYTGLQKGYQFMQDAYVKDGILPPAEWTAGTDADTLFSMQKIACVIAGRWEVTSFRSLDFNWDVSYVPAFSTNAKKNMYSGSVGYAVYNGSSHKEAAWKLVEYIASREGQEILSATGFQIPCYQDVALSTDVVTRETANGKKPQNYACFVNSAQNQSYGLWQYRANSRWKTLGYDTTSEHLYDSDASKRLTVDEFLAQAKTAVTENL